MKNAYIGIKSCGCVVAITTGDDKYMRQDIINFLKQGYSVKCVTLDYGRSQLKKCLCEGRKGEL